jgi:hypothetical protein
VTGRRELVASGVLGTVGGRRRATGITITLLSIRTTATACNAAGTAFSRPQLTALEIFCVRCEVRALLVDACELDLHQAVDVLQVSAMATGLVDAIGQDAVQEIMAAAFAKVRA